MPSETYAACRPPKGVLRHIVASEGYPGEWEIDSAGTGRYHIGDLPDQRMRVHARRRGYDLTHRCRQVTRADFSRFDLIIPMDASNEADLRRMASTLEEEARIVPMASFVDMAIRCDHIPDPYYEGAEGFEKAPTCWRTGAGICTVSLRMPGSSNESTAGGVKMK